MNPTPKAKHVLAALPIVAQAMARKAHVEIVFDASAPTAATDGRRIILPTLPMPTSDSPCEGLEKLAVLAYGYIDHEVGHVLFSDFDALKMAKKKTEAFLLNAIEDPRQEMDLIATYPGTRGTLDALSIQLIRDNTQGVSSKQAPGDLVAMTVHAWLRAALRNEPAYQDIADDGMSLVETTLGVGVRHRLVALLAGPGLQMQDTRDALNLALSITQMLKEEAEKAQQQQEQQEQEQPGTDKGQSQPTEQGGQDGPSAQPPQDGAGQQSGAPQHAPDGQQGASNGADNTPQGSGCGSGQDQPVTAEQVKALQAAATGEGAKGFEDRGATVAKEMASAGAEVRKQGPTFTMEEQRVSKTEPEGKLKLGGPLNTQEAERASAKLQRRMNVMLETKSRVHNSLRDEGQRLSIRHLTNIAVQDPRVFVHRSQARRVDTAVMILTDCSSSMAGREIEIANGGVYAASKAMESLRGVKVAAMAFPGNAVLKNFDAPVMSVIQNFRPSAAGSTPLTEALFSAARHLRFRREPRKIVLVLTDGKPNNGHSAEALLKALPGLGLEVYGIGICHPGVTDLFGKENARVVDTIEDLPEAIFSMLQQQLAA